MYIALNSYAQVSCDNFVVQQIQMDATQQNWEITIFFDADPAAFNGTRFWVSTGVKVEINDKKDPTPYWLISSRKAKLLASKLN